MIFGKYANIKYKYGDCHFWRLGYCVDAAGRKSDRKADKKSYVRRYTDTTIDDEGNRPVHGSASEIGRLGV